MSRNRFQLLLNFIHFADSRNILPGDKLGKLSPISDMLQANFQKVYMPGENIVIDESIIPWRGRLSFRQYLPNKTHPYGVKLFKLCTQEGYTWSIKVYSGKVATGVRETGLAQKVCEELSCLLKGEGRTLFVDNYYTSYELVLSMLHQNTHLVGTLRANKKNCPAKVMKSNLKRGEMVALEEENGMVVLKWKDTRDVRILSMKHPPVMVATSSHPNVESYEPSTSIHNPPSTRKRRQEVIEKLLAIIDYNKAKLGVDVSDQMTSYATTLRRGVKWYRKVAFELLFGMSVVNAYIIYKKATNKQISVTTFRQEISKALLDFTSPEPITKGKHFIEKRKDENGKTIRRACVLCYAMSKKSADRVTARKSLKRTTTYCPTCPNKPQLCLECFPKYSHQKK